MEHRPEPQPTDVTRPFFEAADRGVLVVQRCTTCGTHYAPGVPRCEECLGEVLEWTEASGTGTLLSYVMVHRAFHPAYADLVPYNVALVELTEGPRLLTTLVDLDDTPAKIDGPVHVVFDGPRPPLFTPVRSPGP